MPKTKRLHFKDIDALRFFAFVPIFAYCVLLLTLTDEEGIHFEITSLASYIAINSLDFFFFISAFLITAQGLREFKYNEKFALRSFFARRILRILPLLIFGLVFAFVIHPWVMRTLKLNVIEPLSYWKYFLPFPNYFYNVVREQQIYLGVICSIYMFVQFYFVWGIILKFFKTNLRVISFSIILVGLTARIIHHFTDTNFLFDTMSYGVPIGFGALLAELIRGESKLIDKIKTISKRKIVVIYFCGVSAVLFGYLLSTNFLMASLLPIVTCTFFSVVVIEQTFGKNSIYKLRNNKVIIHLGKISYGLILYQSILNVLLVIGIHSLEFEMSSLTVKIGFGLLSFVMTWIVADVSFNLIEKPLIRLRREFKKI